MSSPSISRRSVLAAGAGVTATAALAACGNSTSTPSSAGTPSTPLPPTTQGGSDGSSDGGGNGGAGGTPIVAEADVPVGGSVSATSQGNPVVVSQPSKGKFACFSAVCTHMGCTVNPAGKELRCPCHGSLYNAFTGQVITGPAPAALPKVAFTVANGEVVAT